MAANYRIIYYWDTRYNLERYIIVKGTYQWAIAAKKHLESFDFITSVSRYYPLDRQYVLDFKKTSNEPIRLKPTYQALRYESFWK